MNKGTKILLNAGMTVACLIFLICAATWLVLGFTPLYSLQCDLFHIPAYSGFDLETCIRNYKVLIDYNMFWGAATLKFPDFPMSVSGAFHFKEVKDIFVTMQYAAIGSFVLLVPGFLYCQKQKVYQWKKAVVITALILVAIAGLAIAIDWEATFVLFHKLVFSNDFWLFDGMTDPVIYILPDEVFMTDAICIILLVVAGLLACWLGYRKDEADREAAANRAAARKATGKKSGKSDTKATGKKSGKSDAKSKGKSSQKTNGTKSGKKTTKK